MSNTGTNTVVNMTHFAIVDTAVVDETVDIAKKHALTVGMLQQFGPAGGNPTVAIVGEHQNIAKFLQDEGYEAVQIKHIDHMSMKDRALYLLDLARIYVLASTEDVLNQDFEDASTNAEAGVEGIFFDSEGPEGNVEVSWAVHGLR